MKIIHFPMENTACRDSNISMASTDFFGANILYVAAGTEGPTGGDAGETCFHLKDEGGTMMFVAVNSGEFCQVDSVTLSFVGDSELNTFLQALAFGFGEIEKQKKANRLS